MTAHQDEPLLLLTSPPPHSLLQHQDCSFSVLWFALHLQQHAEATQVRSLDRRSEKKKKQIQEKKAVMSLENNDSERWLPHYDEIMAGGGQPRPMTFAVRGTEAARLMLIVLHSIKNS